jgi:hypothetical protein
MAIFVVSYDLRKVGQDYETLWTRLGEWKAIRLLDSVWGIKWDITSVALRDDLRKHMDANDGLLVVEVTAGAWSQLKGQSGQTFLGWFSK